MIQAVLILMIVLFSLRISGCGCAGCRSLIADCLGKFCIVGSRGGLRFQGV